MRRVVGGRGAQVAAGWAVLLAFVVASAGPSFASTFVQPAHAPVVVPVAGGHPVAVTVVASGFAKGALVYVEQCDGVSPSAPQWSPTAHCDLGSSPAAAIADAQGIATFAATDRNRAFIPFVGESPQSIFNCLAPKQAAPNNRLPAYTNCSIRVSTNNTAVTSDQSFLALALSTNAPNATGVTTTVPGASSATSTTSSTTVTGSKSTTSGIKKAGAATTGAKPGAKPGASPAPTAFLAAPSHAKVGVLTLSDSRVATGYILVIVGLLAVGMTIALRLKNFRARPDMSGTQIIGER